MSQPAEVWLRGPLPGLLPPLQPVAHALLQIAEEVSRQVALIPRPADGKSVDLAELTQAIIDAAAKAVAAMPKPADGKDATPEQIAAAVKRELEAWPKPEPVKAPTLDDLRPLVDEAVSVAVRSIQIPAPRNARLDHAFTGWSSSPWPRLCVQKEAERRPPWLRRKSPSTKRPLRRCGAASMARCVAPGADSRTRSIGAPRCRPRCCARSARCRWR